MTGTTTDRKCGRCSKTVLIEHALDASTYERAVGLTLHFRHADSLSQRCADGAWIKVDPQCPKCHSERVTVTQEAWGDATDCPDCGYRDFRSIGD